MKLPSMGIQARLLLANGFLAVLVTVTMSWLLLQSNKDALEKSVQASRSAVKTISEGQQQASDDVEKHLLQVFAQQNTLTTSGFDAVTAQLQEGADRAQQAMSQQLDSLHALSIKNARSGFDTRLRNVATFLAGLCVAPIEEFDYGRLDTICENISGDPDVVLAYVFDTDGVVISTFTNNNDKRIQELISSVGNGLEELVIGLQERSDSVEFEAAVKDAVGDTIGGAKVIGSTAVIQANLEANQQHLLAMQKELFRGLNAQFSTLGEQMDGMKADLTQGQTQGQETITGQLHVMSEQTAQQASTLDRETRTMMEHQLQGGVQLVLVAGALAIVVSLIVIYVIGRAIVGPLTVAVNILRGSSGQVSTSSVSLVDSSSELARDASDGAATVEKLGVTLQEIAGKAKGSSDLAEEAKNLTNGSSQQAGAGADHAVVVANAIGERLSTIVGAMNNVKMATDKTGQVANTIEEIAFQTKMLSINASIEAARAGEAGRSFSVLAVQVQELADRCTGAARDALSLISEAQNYSDQGVEVTDTISQEIQHSLGHELVGLFGDNRDAIAGASRKVEAIAQMVVDMANSTTQCSVAMQQIDQTTQSTARNAEIGAFAAESLKANGQELEHVVEQLMAIVGRGTSQRTGGPHIPPAAEPETSLALSA